MVEVDIGVPMSVHDIMLENVDVDGKDPGEDVAHHGKGHGDVGIASVLNTISYPKKNAEVRKHLR